MLSYLYRLLELPMGTANPFIKRIWTGLPGQYRNDSGQDHGLAVWHLPMEKRRGIRRLYQKVVDRNSEFWTIPADGDLRRHLGGVLGVGSRSFRKTVQDILGAMWWKVSKR
jgi:hypothetical protein